MTPNRRLSPLGRMLTLALNDATVVTKTTAILPLLADLWSDTPLFAPAGSLDHSANPVVFGLPEHRGACGYFHAINRQQRYCPRPCGDWRARQFEAAARG
ncbi:hypothetical protein LP417_06670 [Polaromonas sp. P1-6]|nr:hypothetical protein LP417_06670 [Polaromonas sp. P1-6]